MKTYDQVLLKKISIVNDAQIFSTFFLLLVNFTRFRYTSKKDSADLKYEDILMKSPSPTHPVT